jgi:hypothetical protein
LTVAIARKRIDRTPAAAGEAQNGHYRRSKQASVFDKRYGCVPTFFWGMRILPMQFWRPPIMMGGRVNGLLVEAPHGKRQMDGRIRAQDCIRLAHLTPDPEIRDQLMKMAGQWMAAATGGKQRQTRIQTRHQSTPATFVDTPRSRLVAGAKQRLRQPTGRLQRKSASSGDGRASAIGARSAPKR